MSAEIERRFLLDALPDIDPERPPEGIRQGYLAIDDEVEVRIRSGAGERELTIKGGHGRTRSEEHVAIDEAAFDRLWVMTAGRRIEKERRRIPLGDDLVAELDEYGGALAGLVTAEVEFDSEDAADAFEAPAWLGREITGDRRFANQSLATHGRP